MSQVKFSVFADLHHYPEAFYTNAPERLAAIRKRAEENQVDFVVSLGDFCVNGIREKEIVAASHDFPMPFYHALGNHDTDDCTLAETLEAYRMGDKGYYFFDCKGFRFIILDNNYVEIDGEIRHFELGNYYAHPNTRECLPPEEIAFLKDAVFSSPYPCVLFSHASIERECFNRYERPPRAAITNRQEIMDIIAQANAEVPGKVRLAVNGHHHRDFLRILDNVVFFDLNSASMEWLNNPHDLFPEEITKGRSHAQHSVVFTEPLHAVITLDSDGFMQIDGMKGDYLCGVTREMTDNPPCDFSGRPCTANVQSVKMKLFY
jgi:predicted phosphodiesterase